VYGALTNYGSNTSFTGGEGFRKRISFINFDAMAAPGTNAVATATYGTYSSLCTANTAAAMYRSHILTKTNAVTPVAYAAAVPGGAVEVLAVAAVRGVYQICVSASVLLRHMSDLFENFPIAHGVYLQLQMQINNSTSVISKFANGTMSLVSTSNSCGGLNPLMIASMYGDNGGAAFRAGGGNQTITASVCVGSRVIEPSQIGLVAQGTCGNSVTLNIPQVIMQPIMEQAYLADSVRAVPYEDFFQFTVTNIAAGATFNQLLSNGISNLKKVIIYPVISSASAATYLSAGTPCYQSPFDPCGTSGFGSPLLPISQFNVSIAGALCMAQQERYGYEQWLHELSCTGVNGNLVDGTSTGLLSQFGYEMSPIYTVDLSRMLPAERMIPKSVQIQGQNMGAVAVDYLVWIIYEQVGLRVDILSGSKA